MPVGGAAGEGCAHMVGVRRTGRRTWCASRSEEHVRGGKYRRGLGGTDVTKAGILSELTASDGAAVEGKC
jgi:hypothetical protein